MSTQPPQVPSAGEAFELGRTWVTRAFGGPLFQSVLLLLAVIGLLTAPFSPQVWPNVLIGLVALALWLPGRFGYVRVDEVGLHRRCYRTSTDQWADITKVELHFQVFGFNGARRVIRIHRGRRRHMLTPACGQSKTTAEFTRRLIGEAINRGIATESEAWEPGLFRQAS